MSKRTHAPELQTMINRAGRLTADEVEALGRLWKADEDVALPQPDFFGEVQGEVDYPMATNQQLVEAWQHALDTAGSAGRVDEIEAAEDAGRAVAKDERHQHGDELAKDGAKEAVRSAVLATGVRDLISAEEYDVLTAAWRRTVR